jgi:hypothetical protein
MRAFVSLASLAMLAGLASPVYAAGTIVASGHAEAQAPPDSAS